MQAQLDIPITLRSSSSKLAHGLSLESASRAHDALNQVRKEKMRPNANHSFDPSAELRAGFAQDKVHAVPLGLSAAYLLETDAGLVLIDAGLPHQERIILRHGRALRSADASPPNLRLIFITHAHFDHYGSAAALRRLTGAPVAIHRADAEAMARGETRLGLARGSGKLTQVLLPLVEWCLRPEPVKADLLLEDGDRLDDFGLEARVIHTPGHTLGSSCLIVEERLGFVGDLITNDGRPSLQRLFAEDWSLLRQSYARLRGIELEMAYPGHGRRPVTGKALQQLIASHL
jgi:glyoxylase-like metal-dependent hydrolase (beta-lactamase superfamily II)